MSSHDPAAAIKRCTKVVPHRWGDRCYLPDRHDGECRFCAACEGDPEAHDLHVCGRNDGD